MRAVYSSSRPCRLQRGEVRRVPQDRTNFLIGYHVCCPRCGFVTACVQHDGLEIVETKQEGDITFVGEVKCVYCRVQIEIERGEIKLTEGTDVRAVQYK